MRINGNKVDTRHQRPTVLGPTALLLYFVNDGQYTDPHAISGVSIFAASDNESPSSVITADGQIDASSSVTGSVLMHFSNSASLTTDSAFDASNYNASSTPDSMHVSFSQAQLSQAEYLIFLEIRQYLIRCLQRVNTLMYGRFKELPGLI